MDKLYDVAIDFKVDSRETEDNAIITFEGDIMSKGIYWPEQKSVELAEGYYNVSVYVYSDASINIPESTRHECVQVPKPGLSGLFGATSEKCYELTIPSQTIDNALSGGGKVREYFVESQLRKEEIRINVESLPAPSSLEQVQNNYNLVEARTIEIDFI
jgi:hypothetical protein